MTLKHDNKQLKELAQEWEKFILEWLEWYSPENKIKELKEEIKKEESLRNFLKDFNYLKSRVIDFGNFERYKYYYLNSLELYNLLGDEYIISKTDISTTFEGSLEKFFVDTRKYILSIERIEKLLREIHPDFRWNNILILSKGNYLDDNYLWVLKEEYFEKYWKEVNESIFDWLSIDKIPSESYYKN